jgi:hypothetical protein
LVAVDDVAGAEGVVYVLIHTHGGAVGFDVAVIRRASASQDGG